MRQKISTFFKYLLDPKVKKLFLFRYAFGQGLAATGLGQFLPFRTPHYRLYLSKSPVAMVLFGAPDQEREEEKLIERYVQPGDTVIDIGANIGSFSLKAAKLCGPNGRVFAFEAQPRTIHYLKRNLDLNQTSNVTVLACALGEEEKETLFSDQSYDDVNHVVTGSATGVRVPMHRLDGVIELKQASPARLIKIDVEGYELPVLRGGETTIQNARYVIFEAYEASCRRFGYSREELFAWFTDRGFSLLDPETDRPLDLASAGRTGVKNVLAARR